MYLNKYDAIVLAKKKRNSNCLSALNWRDHDDRDLESESHNFSFVTHDNEEYISGSFINYFNEQTASAENYNSKVLNFIIYKSVRRN